MYEDQMLKNEFWALLEEAEPYIANDGKEYCEIKAKSCYTANMWCRLIPGVKHTLHNGKVVRICIN